MARFRKVSNKSVRGQKKDKGILKSKKFWIISILSLLVVVAAIITTVVIVNNLNKEETVEVDDYFNQTHKYTDKSGKEQEINFTKGSYSSARMHTNVNYEDTYVDYLFVFVTDLSTFYPFDIKDSNGDVSKKKDEEHEKVFNALCQLQYAIDEYNANNESNKKAMLMIIDTAANAENVGLLTNEFFVGSELANSESATSFVFSLVNIDGCDTEFAYQSEKNMKNLLFTSFSTYLSDQNNYLNYIQQNFEDYED